MKALVLGGTGAMGRPIQGELLNQGYKVHVTSRSKHESRTIEFHQGNSHDVAFLSTLLKSRYDIIIDFMSYNTDEFKTRVNDILESTGHYIFLSSSRVYSPCNGLLRESHPRLLDICNDHNYLQTKEYALEKARQENILFDSKYKNWTIIRPSLTYNSNRLQFVFGEKEEWLFRYLHNEQIIVPRNTDRIYTTMSHGSDVAKAIALIAGNEKAKGEAVHIAGSRAVSWDEIHNVYWKVLTQRYGRAPNIFEIDNWKILSKRLRRYYQMKYARLISRKFDNSKLESLIGHVDFIDPTIGLEKCLNKFLDDGAKFDSIPWRTEACFNQQTGDKGVLNIFSLGEKAKYIIARYTPYLDWTCNK